MELAKDSSTLAEITKIAQAEAIQKLIQDQTDGTAVAIPEGVKVADLEQYLQNRRRYRGTMNTMVIDEFIEFVTATEDSYGVASSNFPCFVNPEAMAATTYFNLGDTDYPGHGDHLAKLKLKRTSTFEEVLKINGNKLEQRELAEWMEDWVDVLAATNEHGDPIPMSAAVAGIRRITIGSNAEATSEQTNFGSKVSAMAEVEAKNRDQLPAFLQFICEPYQGLSERTFTLRLNIITGEKPRIGVRIVRLETAEEEMAKELEELLRVGFEDTAVRTFVGTFNPGT